MPWRCAFDLVTSVRCLRGRLRASSKAKRWMRSTPVRVKTETSVATSIGRPRCARPPLPEYSPSEFSRMMTQSMSLAVRERALHARQHARRAHVGVLVEALADRQAQAPQRDVVGHLRAADRAEEDRVERSSASPGRPRECSRRAPGSARELQSKCSTSSAKPPSLRRAPRAPRGPRAMTSMPMPSPPMAAIR